MTNPTKQRRIVIFSRYSLADQYDLAPEFQGMLEMLAAQNDVLHLSFKGFKPVTQQPARLHIVELPVCIDRRSSRSILRDSLRMYLCLPKATRVIRAFKPDLVFLTEILPLVGLFFHYTCRTRIATAYGDWHFHNMLAKHWWSKPVLRLAELLDRFEVRRLDGFFCRAQAAGERVRRWGKPSQSVCIVRDAPDPHAYFPRDQTALRKRCGFSEEDVVLSYHGVMHAGKGLDHLIRWTDALYQADPRLGLLLIGSGPEEQNLRALADKTAMKQRIVFTGWLPSVREVGDYINASDIGIAMRTKAEANDRVVPGALLHNMACRKVTVAPDLSGCAEIIRHNVNGFLFEADNGKSFISLVRSILASADLKTAVAEEGYADIMQNYSVAMAERNYTRAIEHFCDID